MARVADGGDPQARQCRHPRGRQRREFPAGGSRRRQGARHDADRFLTSRGVILTQLRVLWASAMSAADGRQRGREPRRGRRAQGVRGVMSAEQTDLQEDRADRRRPDRLFDRTRGPASRLRPSMSRATSRAPRRAHAREAAGFAGFAACGDRVRPCRVPISSCSARPSARMGRWAREIAPHLAQGRSCPTSARPRERVVRDVGPLFRSACISFRPIRSPAPSFPAPMPVSPRCLTGAGRLLTPLPGAERNSRAVRAFWRGCGIEVQRMEPAHHDRVLAIMSHLPHLMAFTMSARPPTSRR